MVAGKEKKVTAICVDFCNAFFKNMCDINLIILLGTCLQEIKLFSLEVQIEWHGM